MRDEELVLRFFAFHIQGIESYRTPQKYWLNEAAKKGQALSQKRIETLRQDWQHALEVALIWFKPEECFRRLPIEKSRPINRALFDLTMHAASRVPIGNAPAFRKEVRSQYVRLLKLAEFNDLISRAVDHTKRNKRRFEMWDESVGAAMQ